MSSFETQSEILQVAAHPSNYYIVVLCKDWLYVFGFDGRICAKFSIVTCATSMQVDTSGLYITILFSNSLVIYELATGACAHIQKLSQLFKHLCVSPCFKYAIVASETEF